MHSVAVGGTRGIRPHHLLLSDDEFWTFITSPDVYATAEAARLLFANKRRGLLEMDAAAVGVLEALGRSQ